MGITILVVVAGIWVLRVNEIDCEFGEDRCPAEVVASLSVLRGKSLLFSHVLATSQTAVQSHTGYRVAGIEKEFPDTVRVILEPQSLLYRLKLLQQTEYRAVTDQRKLIPSSADTQLPQIILEPTVWNTWTVDGQVPELIHLHLLELPVVVNEVGVSPEAIVVIDHQTMILYLPNQQLAILNTEKLTQDIARLAILQRGLQGQEFPQPIQEIDLRFKLPVLRFERTITRHETL